MGKITVVKGGSRAPCCFVLCLVTKTVKGGYVWDVKEEESTILVSLDYDFVGIATSFGFDLRSVQEEGNCCSHPGTDGTVSCAYCCCTACMFICKARKYLNHCADCALIVDDPGYFNKKETTPRE